jgi:hypothetical protein
MMQATSIILAKPTVIAHDAPLVLDFIPPLQKRRLSPLQQRTFAIANMIAGHRSHDYRFIFASRDGEDSLTRKLVDAFNQEGDVSPMRFSTSVYNAAPGLYSILTKNEASYSAIAAEDETLDCSLLEALMTTAPCLWVYAEETSQTPTLGVFLKPSTEPLGEDDLPCQLTPGNPAAAYLTAEAVADFLQGTTRTLVSPYFTLTRCEQ